MRTSIPFEQSPLLTPERILADPHDAFIIRPHWARDLTLLPTSQAVHCRVPLSDGKWRSTYVFTPWQLAVLFEITRLPRVFIRVDNDGAGRLYLRLFFGDRHQDHTMVGRLLLDAGEYDRVRFMGTNREDMRPENFIVSRRGDMRPESLQLDGARRKGKWARSDTLRNATRLANAWETSGDMPGHLTAQSYIANLERLLEAVDGEVAALPIAA